MFADLAVAGESEVFVGGESAVVEETGGDADGRFGVALDGSAAELGDQVERTGERCGGDALAAVSFDEQAIRQSGGVVCSRS